MNQFISSLTMLKLERHKNLLTRIVRTVHRQPLHQSARQAPIVSGLLNVDSLSRHQRKHIASEYAATLRLLSRSTGSPTALIARQLHATCAQFARGAKSSKTPRKKDEPEKAAVEEPDPPKKNDKDDEDDEKKNEKLMSLLTKAVLWMATLYILTLVLTMMLPRKDQPETSTRLF